MGSLENRGGGGLFNGIQGGLNGLKLPLRRAPGGAKKTSKVSPKVSMHVCKQLGGGGGVVQALADASKSKFFFVLPKGIGAIQYIR